MRPSNQAQLDKLKTRLNALPDAIEKAVSPRLDASGTALVAEMQRLCPVSSGALRDSIHVAPSPQSTQIKVEVGGASAPYALHVEFGTRHMKAEPFFFPAFRVLKARISRDIKKAAIDAVRDKGTK